jgi:SnoaL-like domain
LIASARLRHSRGAHGCVAPDQDRRSLRDSRRSSLPSISGVAPRWPPFPRDEPAIRLATSIAAGARSQGWGHVYCRRAAQAASPHRNCQALLRCLQLRRCRRRCGLLHAGRRPLLLAPGTKPVHGSEHLGRYWHKVVRLISAEWRVEHAIACDDEAAIEWSMRWTSGKDGERYIWHGAEWYAFRDGLICEIRAYYNHGPDEDTGLVGFPYADRRYTVVERTRPRISRSRRGPGRRQPGAGGHEPIRLNPRIVATGGEQRPPRLSRVFRPIVGPLVREALHR